MKKMQAFIHLSTHPCFGSGSGKKSATQMENYEEHLLDILKKERKLKY
jgi:hypothetical protein